MCLERGNNEKKSLAAPKSCSFEHFNGSFERLGSRPITTFHLRRIHGIHANCPRISLIYCELYKSSYRIRKSVEMLIHKMQLRLIPLEFFPHCNSVSVRDHY